MFFYLWIVFSRKKQFLENIKTLQKKDLILYYKKIYYIWFYIIIFFKMDKKEKKQFKKKIISWKKKFLESLDFQNKTRKTKQVNLTWYVLSRNYFENQNLTKTSQARIDKTNLEYKRKKKEILFSRLDKKEKQEILSRLDFERKSSLDLKNTFKRKSSQVNFLYNNLSKDRKKDLKNIFSRLEFEKRQDKRKSKILDRICL